MTSTSSLVKDVIIPFIKDDNSAGRLHYFGPTKAEISLVFPFTVKTGGGR